MLEDIIRRGEADVAELIESAENALDSVTKRTPLWEVVDGLVGAVSSSAQAYLRLSSFADRVRERAKSLADRVGNLIERHWRR